ncbi:hypothetical protein PoB_003312700 [Plakobranchus ocellatus]|uniref:Uncharacterized protein n=1 Tax=Plakobranchus ocellatus TaxID=259542 RepID=A0AAV4AH83_9GAST|nr:hypothetical protein PoB_003312700 [Plakobranchus ocellatus]
MRYGGFIAVLLVVAAVLVSSTLGQIHFSPGWKPGKRFAASDARSLFEVNRYRENSGLGSSSSMDSSYDSDSTGRFAGNSRDIHSCTEQVNYRLLLDMAKILADDNDGEDCVVVVDDDNDDDDCDDNDHDEDDDYDDDDDNCNDDEDDDDNKENQDGYDGGDGCDGTDCRDGLGVGSSVDNESALRSAVILLTAVRVPPLAPWPDGEPESLRSSCCD